MEKEKVSVTDVGTTFSPVTISPGAAIDPQLTGLLCVWDCELLQGC